MRLIVSNSLRLGVFLSMAIVITGLFLMLISGSTGYNCDLSTLSCLLSNTVRGSYPTTIVGIIQGLSQAKPYSIIELGVIVLIATPAIRVLTSLGVFVAEKDRKFVLITLFVFVVLLFSFFAVPFIQLLKG